jgi:hypothetical protein
MSDIGELFNALKKKKQEKRANNRDQSAEYLVSHGIIYTTNNGGAHLIVEGKEGYIDFWPGTGRWNSRCGKKGFGVRNLVEFINGHTESLGG